MKVVALSMKELIVVRFKLAEGSKMAKRVSIGYQNEQNYRKLDLRRMDDQRSFRRDTSSMSTFFLLSCLKSHG